MEKRLASKYYSPNGYWKGFGAIKKLAQAANISENLAKRWLFKQALWQIYTSPRRGVEFLARNLTFPHPTRSTFYLVLGPANANEIFITENWTG